MKVNLTEELKRREPQRVETSSLVSRVRLAVATHRKAGVLAILAAFQAACALDWRDAEATKEIDASQNSSASQGVEQSAECATSLLDAFAAQAEPLVLEGHVGASDVRGERYDTDPAISGGHRHVALSIGDAYAGRAVVATGGGRLRFTQTDLPEANAEIAYGAFVHPLEDPNAFGPLLGLDLSETRGIVLSFTDLSDPVGVTVTYYSSQALDPSEPVFYAHATAVVPSSDGPTAVFLAPDDDGAFNWGQVDGVALTLHLQTSESNLSVGLNAVAAFP